MKLRSKEYLAVALRFKKEEKLLRSMFNNWLPEEFIDCHVHVGHSKHIIKLDNQIYYRPLCSFPDFNLEQSYKVKRVFHPNKKISAVRMPTPFNGMDHRGLNDYLFEKSLPTDKIALCGIPNDIDYTIKSLKNKRVAALKMYYMFFSPPAQNIYLFFPKAILYEAQSKGIPIILHLPNTASKCIDQVNQLTRDFPNLKVILAHLGIYSEPLEDLKKAYDFFSKNKNIYVDTAMVFSDQAIKIALKYFGENRVLYGSDEPLDLLRVVRYQHPVLGTRLISQYKYHWISQGEYDEYKHLALNTVHAHWQTLLSIKLAIESEPKNIQDIIKKKIFFENSNELFSSKI